MCAQGLSWVTPGSVFATTGEVNSPSGPRKLRWICEYPIPTDCFSKKGPCLFFGGLVGPGRR